MKYCRKCGFSLQTGDLFCPQCGEENRVESLNNEVRETVTAPETVEEGIALANKLAAKYDALKNIKDELEDCETQLKRSQACSHMPRHSAFKFFWPFLIIAVIVFWVVSVAVYLIFMNADISIYFAEFAGLIAAAVILIAGGTTARNKRDALNCALADEEHRKRKYSHDLEKKVEELKQRRNGLIKSAAEYNTIVPINMRARNRMEMVAELLESGRAESFAGAIEICSLSKNH